MVSPSSIRTVSFYPSVVRTLYTDLSTPLHEPGFRGTKGNGARDCLDSCWVSTIGSAGLRFEDELSSITGAEHVVAVSNGTVALRLALSLVGVSPGDEVIIPPLSFVATANAVSHLGATPHFVDIDEASLGLCPSSLSTHLQHIAVSRAGSIYNRHTGARISAIVPVHVFGNPARLPELYSVASHWGLPIVEDSAEALGVR